jgi:hypothetical protein
MKPKKSPPAKKTAPPRPRRITTAAADDDGVAPRKTRVRTSVTRKTSVRTTASRKKTDTAEPLAATGAVNTTRRKTGRKPTLEIPPILLEGDQPTIPAASGPGRRYALGPTPPVEQFPPERELPEAYGTKQLLLTARDPHWLYAHWDLSREQQLKYNSLSADNHVVLRVHRETLDGQIAAEAHAHPESRHWFIHVDRAGATYVAELGYYQNSGRWAVISTSGPTLTPPDSISADTTTEFATIPLELPFETLLALVKDAVQEHVPLARAVEDLRAQGHPGLPEFRGASAQKPAAWTPAQERALAEVVSMDRVRRVWMGSLEITELIRRQAIQELASISAAQLGAPTSPSGISSLPGARGAAAKGFWFNVNAELIVYGATEPSAAVTIGGRKIRLRPDGSFSYRFALPDGQYEMPIVAVSADQTDGRAAELKFSRSTEFHGDVGAHPQDPELQQLSLANF